METITINEESNDPKVERQELFGDEGGRLLLEFLEASDIGLSGIEPTSKFDQNDRNGIDAVGRIDGINLAIDVTFNDGEKLREKEERNRRNPSVYLHDETGKPIGDILPRILIRDRSQANWMKYAEEAKKRGGTLVDVMGPRFVKKKKVEILEQILRRIDELSFLSPDYSRQIKPAKKIFGQHLEELAAH